MVNRQTLDAISKQNGHGYVYPRPFQVQKRKVTGKPRLSRDRKIFIPEEHKRSQGKRACDQSLSNRAKPGWLYTSSNRGVGRQKHAALPCKRDRLISLAMDTPPFREK